MKLYREVKASERLPEMNHKGDTDNKDYYVHTNLGMAQYCGSDNWMIDYEAGGFEFGKMHEIIYWLEPIEITEEEIIEIFSAIWYTDLHGLTGLEEAITELLSKLKGE